MDAQRPAPLPAPAPPPGPAAPVMSGPGAAPTSRRRVHLHPVWRYGLVIAWAAALVGLLVPENMGYTLGKLPFWWDAAILVVAAVVVVVTLILRDWRWAPLASIAMSLVLVVLALPDLGENPGIAVKQLAVDVGILLVSIGALSAWDPKRGDSAATDKTGAGDGTAAGTPLQPEAG